MTHTLQLCTWNIQFGLRLGQIVGALESHADFAGLDLLALQEASEHGRQADARAIASALGPSYESLQATAHVLRGRKQANALVWNTRRVHVDAHHVLKLPAHHEVALPRAERALLRALPRQSRSSLVVDGRLGHASLRIYVVHFDVVGFAHKREQLACVLADARARPPVDTTFIAGDLNTFRVRSRPSWAALRHAAEAERFVELTGAIGWTHSVRSLRLKQKLDAIFVRHAHPLRCRAWALHTGGSDHIPVFADIELD